MPGDDEGGAAARMRNWPSRGQGTAILACEQGAAPESGYHGQELARWAGGKRDAGLQCGNSPSKCASMDRNWRSQGRGTTMLAGEELAAPGRWRQRAGGGHLWEGEERCRLAKREQ